MKNRFKDQRLDMFADYTSYSLWWPNQFNLLLSMPAYYLINILRRIVLQQTRPAQATA
jgi:Transposase DDE domain group 1